MKNKNVLVTGGGGMVAQQLVRLLTEEDISFISGVCLDEL
jgi:FlaA1/EpsC-like NDP-sugar epimerase